MISSRTILSAGIALALAIFAAAVAAQDRCASEAPDRVALEAFDHAVSAYVDLRRRIETSLPPLRPLPAEELTRAVDALAAAIRTARADAAPGDVFGPGAARVFRRRIEATLAAGGNTVGDLLAEHDDEEQFGLGAIGVNSRFPHGRGTVMWPDLLAALPRLPRELQYRLVGQDLVLLDIDANMVVDILKDALPADRTDDANEKRRL